MKITEFAKVVTEAEGMKKSVSIAQVKEILRIINVLTCGFLYAKIREIKS